VLIPIVLTILRSDQWRDLGRRTNPSSLAPANLTAACLSLELAEKLNNYLNIYRIDKSSQPPASRGSKFRQMRSRPSKDAVPMAQKWREENCTSILTTPLWKSGSIKQLDKERSSFRNRLHVSAPCSGCAFPQASDLQR
jgi:hypothetical protein